AELDLAHQHIMLDVGLDHLAGNAEAHCLLLSAPKGRQSIAQGASPGYQREYHASPNGATETTAAMRFLSPRWGFILFWAFNPGLAPWAIFFRPFGAGIQHLPDQ